MIRPTRFKELSYERQESMSLKETLWRFIDTSTGNAVGPIYKSEIELLTDLYRYAKVFGCNPGSDAAITSEEAHYSKAERIVLNQYPEIKTEAQLQAKMEKIVRQGL